MSRKVELYLQQQIAEYMRLQYPDVIFRSDLGGIRLTIGQAVQVKKLQCGRSFPDMFVCEPRGKYAGLFGELKSSYGEVYRQSGKVRQTKHIQEQLQMLQALRERGYQAQWWFGFDDAQAKIDQYLHLPPIGVA